MARLESLAALAVVCLTLSAGAAVAAGGSPLEVAWTWTTGGPDRDAGSAVTATAEGDLLLAGTMTTRDTATDAFLQRRTPDGSIQWTRRYGGPGAQSALDVVPTDDGGAILLADDVPADGDRDVVLRRIAGDGSVRWERRYGTVDADETAYALVDAGEGYAFAGFTAATDASLAAWLVRVGPDGEKRWERTYAPGRISTAYDLEVTSGGFVLAGVTTDGQTVLRGGEGWLAKVGTDGSLQWSQRYGGSSGDSLKAVVELPDGYALAGFTTSYGNGTASAWLVRTDRDGNLRWNRSYGQSQVDVAADLARTEEGFLLLGEGAPDGDFDVQFRRISETGDQLAVRSIGGDGEEGAGDLTVVNGTAIATGASTTGTGTHPDAYVVGVVAPPPVAGGEVPLAGILLSAGLVIGVAVLTLREIRRE
jgi:hypothetical protein